METVIILTALIATAVGCLILLSCLAGKRAQLFRAFEIQQENEAHERKIRESNSQANTAGANDSDSSAAVPTAQPALPSAAAT